MKKTTMLKTLKLIILQLFVYVTVSATTYYVSPHGDNANNGMSEDQPFKEVQFAVEQMTRGDVLIVLDGFYTGRLKLKSGITIRAKYPRKVIFSGAEPINGKFEKHAGNIYKAKIDKEVKQMFFNNQPMTWAQWPNMQWTENNIFEKKWAKATDGTGPGVLTSESFNEVKDIDIVGGYCFIHYGKGNSCYSRLIESFDGTTLHWNDDNFYESKYTGEDGRKGAPGVMWRSHIHPRNSEFFLAGDLDLLDAPGEWFVEDNILYFYPPQGIDPNEADILIKTNDYSIRQSTAVSDITIDGIDFLATSVKLDSEDNIDINFRNSYFTYIGAEFLFIDRIHGAEINKPVFVRGTKISFDKCLFAGAQNSALELVGGDVTVQNCVFMENNRHANFESRSLLLFANEKYKITRNTFFNNASDAIRIVPDLDEMKSLNPEVSYNHIFNQGKYNSDVSGIYMPSKSQRYAEVHHNWIHNSNANCIRLDLAGKELSVHHNVTWSSYRGLTIEGYKKFNVYNNTSLYNETPSDMSRNVLNHSGVDEASLDLSFPPIDDWNILNNLIEKLTDRVGPREKTTLNQSGEEGILHPERKERWLFPVFDFDKGSIPIVDRGSIQGNLTGERHGVFNNADLSGLNLIPNDEAVNGGVKQTEELRKQGVCCLDSFRGAYGVNGEYWYPGSDWMPYGLPVLKTMAEAEQFAQKYSTISLLPEIEISQLAWGSISKEEKSQEVIIRAEENMDYGVDSVAVMISETLYAPDGQATCQIACDVTPAIGASIMSRDVYNRGYTRAWGLGFDNETTENRLREINNNEWVSISNLRIENFQTNGSSYTINDSSLAFQGFTVHKAGHKNGYDLVMFEVGETKHIAKIANDDPTFVNVADSAGFGLSAFAIGADQGDDTNKWQVLNLVVKAVWQELPTGLTENLPEQLLIYPNPVTDLFYVKGMPVSTEIYSITGKKLKQFPEGISSFDVSSLTKGVYIIKVTTKMGNVLSQKLVKR